VIKNPRERGGHSPRWAAEPEIIINNIVLSEGILRKETGATCQQRSILSERCCFRNKNLRIVAVNPATPFRSQMSVTKTGYRDKLDGEADLGLRLSSITQDLKLRCSSK
jgi:hypothetical protein